MRFRTAEEWRALHAKGLTCAEAAERAGTSKSGAWRAAERLGFKWRRVAPDYARSCLPELTPAQREVYRMARDKGFPAPEALEVAKTHRERRNAA